MAISFPKSDQIDKSYKPRFQRGFLFAFIVAKRLRFAIIPIVSTGIRVILCPMDIRSEVASHG